MEEYVGGLWDRFITRSARRDHPEAAVKLADLERTLGVLFRALGGDAGLRVAPAASQRHGARRRWLSRLAATDERTAPASLDLETLRLPPEIACFPERALNRDLFVWLIAVAAHEPAPSADAWIVRNQIATLRALKALPGLRSRYDRLVAATLAERIAPAALPADEAAQERAVRQALAEPGTVGALPPLTLRKAKPLQPVPLWLYPSPLDEAAKVSRGDTPEEKEEAEEETRPEEVGVGDKRYRAERADMPDNEAPMMLAFRAESLLSWAEYLKVNRALDDDPDPGAKAIADDMDKLAVAQDNERVASKVRFDLDLPSAAADDLPLGAGIPLPEWDWKRHELRADYCRLQVMQARQVEPIPLPEHLRRPARKLRNQFAALAPARRWLKAQPDGTELDVDACVRLQADRLAGQHFSSAGAYLSMNRCERDLACLVLADLSLSTDAWVSDSHRVIDVIRDSLMLFGEALAATGDRYAFHGFSSLRRDQVRFHYIKDFAAPFDAAARGRIAALKPGYYTRMGAGIRHATTLLERQPCALRLLLILSDGKPHDMDHYEGRYGVEDTRMALIEARRAGLKPFCVTIDREGASYLPHMFGPGSFTVLRNPEELPMRLPMLYGQLTGH
ncbi:MAG: nitric oxide reductase [Rhodocyclales bacterium]|nr:nitric oxide reductase [Rhodocyclales bacterium]